MQFAKNIPKPKLLPPKQVVLGTNRCFGWQVLPEGPKCEAKPKCELISGWSPERPVFLLGCDLKLADPSSWWDDRHPHHSPSPRLPDVQLGRSWSLRQKPWRRTRRTAGAEVGFKASSWFTLWSWWDTQLKGHMRPTSDNMKKNTFANYAYESLWILYSPEDAPVTICQLRLPGLIWIHIIFSIFFKSNLLFFSHFFRVQMDWTYWFLPMQARQEAVEWEDLRRALGLPVDCWEDLGGQVALGAMWVCHEPAAKYCTPAWNPIFSFLSYLFNFFHILTLVNMMPQKINI